MVNNTEAMPMAARQSTTRPISLFSNPILRTFIMVPNFANNEVMENHQAIAPTAMPNMPRAIRLIGCSGRMKPKRA